MKRRWEIAAEASGWYVCSEWWRVLWCAATQGISRSLPTYANKSTGSSRSPFSVHLPRSFYRPLYFPCHTSTPVSSWPPAASNTNASLIREDNKKYSEKICKNWEHTLFTTKVGLLLVNRDYIHVLFLNSKWYCCLQSNSCYWVSPCRREANC